MKVLLSFCIIIGLTYYVTAEVFSQNGTHPDYPGACYYDDTFYEPGEHIVRRRCTKIICDDKGWISGHDCLKLDYKSNCEPGELVGFGRPYPECCLKKYNCVHDNGTRYSEIDF